MSEIRFYPRQPKYSDILIHSLHHFRFLFMTIRLQIDFNSDWLRKNVPLAKPIHSKHILYFSAGKWTRTQFLWIKYSITNFVFSQFMMYEIRVEAKLSNGILFLGTIFLSLPSSEAKRGREIREPTSVWDLIRNFGSNGNERQREGEMRQKRHIKRFVWFNVLCCSDFRFIPILWLKSWDRHGILSRANSQRDVYPLTHTYSTQFALNHAHFPLRSHSFHSI